MQPYFIFKGINSIDMGVVVNKLPPISKSERNIEKIEVQGRDGFLTQDEDTYKGKIKPVECTLENIDNIDKVCAWLDGSGEVIFSNQPDRYFKATTINQIDFHTPIRIFKRFYVQFDCQPFGYSINEKPVAWCKELLEGLSADTYDLNKIYPTRRTSLNIETIENKKWLKFLHDPTNGGSVPALILNNITLKANTVYTYSFNVYTTKNDTRIRCYNNDGGIYFSKDFSISNAPTRINYTFTTRSTTTYDIFHIVDLNSNEVYYFSDFRLIEGSTEGENLIRGSNLNLHVNEDYGIAIKPVGLDLLKDNVYTFTVNGSVEEEFLKAGGYLRFHIYENTWKERVAVIDIKSTENTTASVKFIPSATGKYYFGAYRYPKDISQSSKGYVNANWGKLEEGFKSTPWSISPLDKELIIENKGTRKSKPNITIEGTGDVNLYINKETIKLKNVEDKITINTEMMECYKNTLPCNNKMYGEFPILNIGSNNITWTGNVNRIEVEKNTVFL